MFKDTQVVKDRIRIETLVILTEALKKQPGQVLEVAYHVFSMAPCGQCT